MKNLGFVLAVAVVLALCVPASATRYFWVGTTGSWHDANNWDTTEFGPGGSGVPVSGDEPCIQNDGTAQIYTADAFADKPRIGYVYASHPSFPGGNGNLELTADFTLDAIGIKLGWGRLLSENNPSRLTQTAGTINVDWLDMAYTYGIGGDARYTISGDATFNETANGTTIGFIGTANSVAVLKIIGDQVTFNCTSYEQNDLSTLEIVLTAAGNVSLINASGDATLEGTLLVDVSAFSGVKTIDVLTAGGTLDYSALSCAYALSDDGAGTLQVTVPEPATMLLLGIGGLGALIRRRRR